MQFWKNMTNFILQFFETLKTMHYLFAAIAIEYCLQAMHKNAVNIFLSGYKISKRVKLLYSENVGKIKGLDISICAVNSNICIQAHALGCPYFINNMNKNHTSWYKAQVAGTTLPSFQTNSPGVFKCPMSIVQYPMSFVIYQLSIVHYL